jgi:phospholipid transport system transporter-binding protein
VSRPHPVAAQSSSAALRLTGGADGRFALEGPLVFATARSAREIGTRLLSAGAGAIEVDCAAVTTADSAGLAVLLDWMRTARSAGRTLRYASLPAGLTALARISEVEALLTGGV